MHKTETSVSDLRKIPGIGENMQKHLNNIGIHCIADLEGRDPGTAYTKGTRMTNACYMCFAVRFIMRNI